MTWMPDPVPGVHGWTVHGEWWHSWAFYIEPYLSTGGKNDWNHDKPEVGIWVCPSHVLRPSAEYIQQKDFAIFSAYGMNVTVLDTNTSGWGVGWPGQGVGIPGLSDNLRHQSKFNAPSRTIQLAEHWGVDKDGTQTLGQNYTWAKFTRPPNVWNPLDPKTKDYVAIPSGKVSSPPALDTIGQSMRIAHRGQSNFLYIDGHVEKLDPWATVGNGAMDSSIENAAWNGRW